MRNHTTLQLIAIGFCKPKFYKPSVWRKAKVVMEWLCDNTNLVERYNYGRGQGKYRTSSSLAELVRIYDASRNS